MRVAVLGGTGVLGRPVIQLLLDRGHMVRAIVTPRVARAFKPAQNLEEVHGDVLQAESLPGPLKGCDAVLHLATAIPSRNSRLGWSLNDRIRREGTRNLLRAAHGGGLRYIQQSVAMLLAGPRDAEASEESPLRGSPMLDSALDMEELVAASPLAWMILRGGLFYGPGTGQSEAINRHAREGRLVMPDEGKDYVSLVRPDDMAEAVALAVESSLMREVFNIVDDCPVTWEVLLRFVAQRLGAPSPRPGGPVTLPSFRVSNAKAKQRLGWRPRFPHFRAGWPLA